MSTPTTNQNITTGFNEIGDRMTGNYTYLNLGDGYYNIQNSSQHNTSTSTPDFPNNSEPTNITNFYANTNNVGMGAYWNPVTIQGTEWDSSENYDDQIDIYSNGFQLRVGYGTGPASGIHAELHNVLASDYGRPFIATEDSHITTKKFVDNNSNKFFVSSTQPASMKVGDGWFNPSTGELKIYTE